MPGLTTIFRLPYLMLFATVALATAAHGESVTGTRAWSNCQGGEGVWPEMRISGCSDVIKSGTASGSDLTIAYYNRANARLQKNEYRKAIDDYTRAIELDPQNASALHERCFARAVLGIDLEDALSDCNESLRIRPNDSETLGGRGFVYLRLGFYRTAIRDYDAALEFKPDTAIFLYARGTAKMETGNAEGGEADIAAARSLDPKIDATFEAYDGASETGGFWGAMVGYWRAAMKWIY